MTRMSAQTFDVFLNSTQQCLTGVADTAAVMVIDNYGDELVVLEINDEAAAEARVDQLLAARPRALALCARIGWTPQPDDELEPSWAITAVCPEFSSRFRVKRDRDVVWWQVHPEEAPLFMWSSAQALRRAMDSGEPLRWRHGVTDEHLQPTGRTA